MTPARTPAITPARAAIALAALALLALAVSQLEGARAGLEIRTLQVGAIPVTVFQPVGGTPAPVVVIGHGFAGSQQLMLPFALDLARAGYVAVTYDQPGHARNPVPMPGDFLESAVRDQQLLTALDDVLGVARPLGDGRVALLGHSMAAQVVLRYAAEHPAVLATVAVSPFAADHVTTSLPRNLLVVDGALEPAIVQDAARRAVAIGFGGDVRPATTYGDFEAGSARRYDYAPGVEHIGVLYSAEARAEAVAWFDQAFGRVVVDRAPPAIGRALGLMNLALVALAWPLAAFLPRLKPAPPRPAAGPSWRRPLVVLVVPALLTPLLLWKVDVRLLPLMLADYLVLHFALYGLLTLALTRWLRAGATPREPAPGAPGLVAAILATAAVTGYVIFAIGLPTDRYATAFLPGPGRGAWIPLLFIGTALWFCADERLARGPGMPRWAYPASKFCFVASLLLAVALNPGRLFFLVIILPAMALFFLVYGLISRWVFRSTGEPLVAGVANAAVFAWAIGVSFPLAG